MLILNDITNKRDLFKSHEWEKTHRKYSLHDAIVDDDKGDKIFHENEIHRWATCYICDNSQRICRRRTE